MFSSACAWCQELRVAVSYGALEPVAAALRAGDLGASCSCHYVEAEVHIRFHEEGASVHEPGPAGGWLPIHTAASSGNLGPLDFIKSFVQTLLSIVPGCSSKTPNPKES